MKTVLPLTFVLFLSLFFSVDVSAQDAFASKTTSEKEAKESVNTIANKEAIPSYYRHHKKLRPFFDGYAIEITTSDLPLQRDYYLFERFGSVKVNRMEKGGFSYLIIGFKNEKAAKKHCDMIARPHAPEARVVRYVKGRRK